MSKKNVERKRRNREQARRLGLHGSDSDLPRAARRKLQRDLKNVEFREDFRRNLAKYDTTSVLTALADLAPHHERPVHAVARLAREALTIDLPGSQSMSTNDARRYLTRVHNLHDPKMTEDLGSGVIAETLLTRLLAEQVPVQRKPAEDWHRILSVLMVDDPGSPLGHEAWVSRLGLTLPALLLGAATLAEMLEGGRLNLRDFRAAYSSPEIQSVFEALFELLGATVDELRRVAKAGSLYDLGPLVQKPLLILEPNLIVAPSPTHVMIAVSLTGHYLRLIREQAGEELSTVVGQRYEGYVESYARTALPSDQWTIRRLDEEPKPSGELTDLAIVPRDMSFVVFIEAKTTLSNVVAEQGGPDEHRQYETRVLGKAVGQLRNSIDSIGQGGFLEGVPTDVPVFAFYVTMERVPTAVFDDDMYYGVPHRKPDRSGVNLGGRNISVRPCSDFEILLDLLGVCPPDQRLEVLDRAAQLGAYGPVGSVAKGLEIDLEDVPMNKMISDALQRFAAAFESPELVALVRRYLG